MRSQSIWPNGLWKVSLMGTCHGHTHMSVFGFLLNWMEVMALICISYSTKKKKPLIELALSDIEY